MNKTVLGLCAIILLSGGAYAYYAKDPDFQKSQMPSYAAESAGMASTTGREDKHSVTWKFENGGESKDGAAPRTKVTVVWDNVSHDAGTYDGTCAEIDGSAGTLQDNEVSGVLCWFAGAGDEIGVFDDNGTFVIKHGEQQEPSGEGDGFRGNFKTLFPL